MSPAALELMRERNARMHSEASVSRGRSFRPRRSDVFVVTYPKCGTTWMTQVCHQIRCAVAGKDGEAFGEITEVVPWDILALDCGQDLDADQTCEPRIFKSHENAKDCARGAKYVVVVRDPRDVFNSFYEFLPAYMGIGSGEITPEEFADAIFAGASHSGGFSEHFLSWYDEMVANPENVLMLSFEDMKDDLGKVTRRVASFMNVELSSEHFDLVLERSGFAYMRENTMFDDHFVRDKIKAQIGLPENSEFKVGKVRATGGTVGEGARQQPKSVTAAIDAKWAAEMSPRGWPTYEEFRREIAARAYKRTIESARCLH